MSRYKTKPCEIEAIKWNGDNHREMFDFLTDYKKKDEYMNSYDDNFYIDHCKVRGGLIIRTLEGDMIASIGDYIIRGLRGEYYPCKPDVFEKKYEIIKN